MEKTEVINLVVIIGLYVLILGIALAWFIDHKIYMAKHQARMDLEKHQEWLFDQLYSLAPGKVSKPDELQPTETSRPAVVIHTSRDPMNEFNGKKDDWF